jgi:ABC-2 type transport system permease protein
MIVPVFHLLKTFRLSLLINTNINLEEAKLDTEAIKKAQSTVNISSAKASGEQTVKGLNEIKAIGGGFGYLIMMFIIIYGNMVMCD